MLTTEETTSLAAFLARWETLLDAYLSGVPLRPLEAA